MTTRTLLAASNIILALTSVASVALATAASASNAQPVEELTELDEVWVHGESIAQRVEAAEDDFFALYNELNTRNRFDVRCGMVILSRDTMEVERKCVPEFAITYAQSYYQPNLQFHSTICAYGSYSPGSWNSHFDSCLNAPGREVLVRTSSPSARAEYGQAVLAVIQSDARLQQKVDGLAELYAELERTQKRYVELKPRELKPEQSTVRPRRAPRGP